LGTFDPATGTTVKWSDRVAATSVEVPDGNYYDVLGINKDKEQVFEESHNKVIKYPWAASVFHEGMGNFLEWHQLWTHPTLSTTWNTFYTNGLGRLCQDIHACSNAGKCVKGTNTHQKEHHAPYYLQMVLYGAYLLLNGT
jgi:hypothetical protein